MARRQLAHRVVRFGELIACLLELEPEPAGLVDRGLVLVCERRMPAQHPNELIRELRRLLVKLLDVVLECGNFS